MTNRLDELMSIPQAARAIGVGRVWIWKLCRTGRIGRKVAGRYAISREDLRRYLRLRRPAGRPPGKKKRKDVV